MQVDYKRRKRKQRHTAEELIANSFVRLVQAVGTIRMMPDNSQLKPEIFQREVLAVLSEVGDGLCAALGIEQTLTA